MLGEANLCVVWRARRQLARSHTPARHKHCAIVLYICDARRDRSNSKITRAARMRRSDARKGRENV